MEVFKYDLIKFISMDENDLNKFYGKENDGFFKSKDVNIYIIT